MKLNIPFGDTTIEAEVPDRTFYRRDGGQTKELKPLADLKAAVDEALAHPLGSAPIRDLAKAGSRVVIAFDDATVPSFGSFRNIAIRAVMAELDAAGVSSDKVMLICANALHRKFPPEELAAILGQDIVDEFGERLICHDAEDADHLTYLGKTPEHGFDVELSSYVTEADLAIYVCAAQNRGFSSGWKSWCVGLSTFRSIRHHHTPDGMSMSVKDNRMHKMLDEMGRHVEDQIDTTFFKIDAIESNFFETSRVLAGDTWKTREAALEIMIEHFPPRRDASPDRYDVVLYGVPNWSPYSIFSKMNPLLTLVSSGLGYLGGIVQAQGKEGCTLIMATPCPNQWDEVHHAPYPHVWENVLTKTLDPYEIERDFTEEYANNEEFIAKYRNEYAFHPTHGIMATHPLRRVKHTGRVIVAGIEDPAIAAHVGFEAAESVEAALEMAEEKHGPDYSIVYAQHPATQAVTKVNM